MKCGRRTRRRTRTRTSRKAKNYRIITTRKREKDDEGEKGYQEKYTDGDGKKSSVE